MNNREFKGWPKIHRLSRECIITEKIDGTNSCVVIDEHEDIYAQSKNRIITPDNDNFGFAQWVIDNREDLSCLGIGYHFGEWWGNGIQRGYGIREKRFSLFNVIQLENRKVPDCCSLVPVLYRGIFDTDAVYHVMADLMSGGSRASPGFMNPEGVVIYHISANISFKKTITNDEAKNQY